MTHRRRGVLTSERQALGAEIREARTEGPPSRPRLRVLVPSQESAAELSAAAFNSRLTPRGPVPAAWVPRGDTRASLEEFWRNQISRRLTSYCLQLTGQRRPSL